MAYAASEFFDFFDLSLNLLCVELLDNLQDLFCVLSTVKVVFSSVDNRKKVLKRLVRSQILCSCQHLRRR